MKQTIQRYFLFYLLLIFRLLYQEYFLHKGAVLTGLTVSVVKDINVISLDTASPVLCCINHTANHDLGAHGTAPGIYGDGMTGAGNGTAGGAASPAFRAFVAGAVGCGTEQAQRTHSGILLGLFCCRSSLLSRSSLAFYIGLGVFKLLAFNPALNLIGTVGKAVPVHGNAEAVVSVADSVFF